MTNLITIYHLCALAAVESAFNDRAVGASGEVSRYQIRPAEWRLAVKKLGTRVDPTDERAARLVAFGLLSTRAEAFVRKQRRRPTDVEIYLLWHRPARVLKPRPVEAKRARRFAQEVEVSRKLLSANAELSDGAGEKR